MIEHPSRTSIMVAAGRAIGAREPDPSVRNPDSLAEQFLGPEIRALKIDHPAIQALDRNYDEAIKDLEVMGTVRMMMIRTRFIEERLEHAIRNGAMQVVIMGAGFDTRAYRLTELLKDAQVFEVDRPATQEIKKRRALEVLGSVPSNLTYVPIDFRHEKLGDVLERAGFQPGWKTVCIWEGVTMYLPEEAVRETLVWVASLAPRSSIVFDFVYASVIKFMANISLDALPEAVRPSVQRLLNLEAGEPWLSGLPDNAEREYLKEVGLEMGELLPIGGEESVKRYLTRADGTIFGAIPASPRTAYCLVEATVLDKG
jgi:methyltransferase (TIGR00027 family)